MDTETVNERFVRKERLHLKALHERLDYVTTENPVRKSEPGFVQGEAQALTWILAVVEGDIEPLAIRLERLEHKVRRIDSRLGRVEHDLVEEDE